MLEDPVGAPPAAQLLTFADAVGSSGRAMRACYERCKYQFNGITVGEGRQAQQLYLHGGALYVDELGCLKCVSWDAEQEFYWGVPYDDWPSVAVGMASQLERMLYRVHRVIFANTLLDGSILSADLVKEKILTDRVMAAVGKEELRDAWFEKMTTHAISNVTSLEFGQPRPVVAEGEPKSRFEATIQLRRPLLGRAAGHREHVVVNLDDMTVLRGHDEGLLSYCNLVLCPRRK